MQLDLDLHLGVLQEPVQMASDRKKKRPLEHEDVSGSSDGGQISGNLPDISTSSSSKCRRSGRQEVLPDLNAAAADVVDPGAQENTQNEEMHKGGEVVVPLDSRGACEGPHEEFAFAEVTRRKILVFVESKFTQPAHLETLAMLMVKNPHARQEDSPQTDVSSSVGNRPSQSEQCNQALHSMLAILCRGLGLPEVVSDHARELLRDIIRSCDIFTRTQARDEIFSMLLAVCWVVAEEMDYPLVKPPCIYHGDTKMQLKYFENKSQHCKTYFVQIDVQL